MGASKAHSWSTAHSESRRRHPADAGRVTLVWLSPGLPADRTELAASLPSDLALFSMPSLDDQAAIDALAVGSLCVATVFETDLLHQLAHRPEGVRLLVVGPPDRPTHLPPPPVGRPPDAMSPASSMSELATAISQAAAGVAPTQALAALAPAPRQSRLRSRLVAAGAVLAGLAIGGIVIAATEGSSAASAGNGVGNGRFGGGGFGGFPGGQVPGGTGGTGGTGQFPGAGPGGTTNGTAPGGQTGGRFDRGAIEQQILTCLRKQGFTGTANQLRVRAADPQLRQAVATCIQQLGNSSSQLSGRP